MSRIHVTQPTFASNEVSFGYTTFLRKARFAPNSYPMLMWSKHSTHSCGLCWYPLSTLERAYKLARILRHSRHPSRPFCEVPHAAQGLPERSPTGLHHSPVRASLSRRLPPRGTTEAGLR